jgi:hypothetical protein
MADSVEQNTAAGRPFAGCIVVIPPAIDGEFIGIIDTLILDPSQDGTQFWGLLKARAEIAFREAGSKERDVTFGRR